MVLDEAKLVRLTPVMININHQAKRPGITQETKLWALPTTEVGRPIRNVDWSVGLRTKEKAGWVPVFLSLCFLTVGAR